MDTDESQPMLSEEDKSTNYTEDLTNNDVGFEITPGQIEVPQADEDDDTVSTCTTIYKVSNV